MLLNCFLLCVSLPLLHGLPVVPVQPHKISNMQSQNAGKDWTDESLCVLKMGSTCPNGFSESQIILSVKPDVNPADKGENDETLIAMGNAGASSLTRNSYDSVYTLKLLVCCKQ